MKEKPRLLIVDDEPFYIDVLTNLLRDEYEISTAKSGELALQLAYAEPYPELILLDILMPGIDGYETCKQLKANPATCNIPIIFLTVKCDVDDELKGFDLGAVDYITKPMSPPIVKARIRTHIRLARIFNHLERMINLLTE
jgi:cyclic di-GMP phosphodiesterase